MEQHSIIKVHTICVCCDLPAKALVQNFIQFNGQYGCGFCEQRGEIVATEKGGNVTTFPFMMNDPEGPRRTQHKCIMEAQKVIREKTMVNNYDYLIPI